MVDFATMASAVHAIGIDPVIATAVGASAGATTNFLLSRTWIFPDDGPRRGPALGGQAARYATVAFASLCLNTLGEYLAFRVLGLNYLVARVAVAILVSLLWNYPLHRTYVFPRTDARE